MNKEKYEAALDMWAELKVGSLCDNLMGSLENTDEPYEASERYSRGMILLQQTLAIAKRAEALTQELSAELKEPE